MAVWDWQACVQLTNMHTNEHRNIIFLNIILYISNYIDQRACVVRISDTWINQLDWVYLWTFPFFSKASILREIHMFQVGFSYVSVSSLTLTSLNIWNQNIQWMTFIQKCEFSMNCCWPYIWLRLTL